jgi:hypothetical protein
MQVLDLRPPNITIKFTKGATLNPIFFYLGKNNSVIDMTGYTAQFQARLNPTAEEVLPGFDLTTVNGGLVIVTADAEDAKGIMIPQAQGVQLNVPSSVTSAIAFRKAIFGLEVTSPNGITSTLVVGILEPNLEVVR